MLKGGAGIFSGSECLILGWRGAAPSTWDLQPQTLSWWVVSLPLLSECHRGGDDLWANGPVITGSLGRSESRVETPPLLDGDSSPHFPSAGSALITRLSAGACWAPPVETVPLPCKISKLCWSEWAQMSDFLAMWLGVARALGDRETSERWLPSCEWVLYH